MFEIPVYRAELDAGIAGAVRGTTSIASYAAVRPWAASTADRAKARLHTLVPGRAKAALDDFDLHYLQTVLATVGWNKNDDVFDPVELWTARHTPAHKPFNYEHDSANIIGHIIADWAMDDAGKTVAEDTAADELPAKFHVATGGVLYKNWDKPDLQERMDNILVGIAKGEWFVSMECLFNGFDYALKAGDGTVRVVARNEKTAFLTKYLRAYGGVGRYMTETIGRVLRNIVFSGKGLVRNPANPESIILPEGASAGRATATISPVDHRVGLAKTRLGMSDQEAAEYVAGSSGASDLQFQAAMKVVERAREKASLIESPDDDEHHLSQVELDIASFFGADMAAVAPLPPKATPAPFAPKATPAPLAPKSILASASNEEGSDGESGDVADVLQSIAAYFDRTEGL